MSAIACFRLFIANINHSHDTSGSRTQPTATFPDRLRRMRVCALGLAGRAPAANML